MLTCSLEYDSIEIVHQQPWLSPISNYLCDFEEVPLSYSFFILKTREVAYTIWKFLSKMKTLCSESGTCHLLPSRTSSQRLVESLKVPGTFTVLFTLPGISLMPAQGPGPSHSPGCRARGSPSSGLCMLWQTLLLSPSCAFLMYLLCDCSGKSTK